MLKNLEVRRKKKESFFPENNLTCTFQHIRQYAAEFVLGGTHDAGIGVVSVEMDGVEAALGGADTAADAAVLIDHRSAA